MNEQRPSWMPTADEVVRQAIVTAAAALLIACAYACVRACCK